MHPQIKYLLDLQSADMRLIEIRDRLGKFPKHLAEAEMRLTAAKSQVAAAKDALTTSLKERKTFEMDVEQWKERARKYRNQSGEVKTNEAYKALQHETQNAENEMAKAEDRLLERMVSGEQYDREVKAAEAGLKEAEAVVAKERQTIQAEYNAAQKELSAAEAARAAVASAVPEDRVLQYARIAQRRGGIGLSEIRGASCGQCGVHIRPHVVQLLQQGSTEELFFCETCTRILYYADHGPLNAPAPAPASDPATTIDPATPAPSEG